MSESRRHDVLAVTILVLLTTLLFADVLAGTHNFYLRDLTRYYYPMKHMLREIVLGGEFPYWTRHFGGGQPLAANPEHEVFYPGTWLLFLPNGFLGYRLHILVHIYIGVLGMYAMLRSMGLRATASFAGAFSFGLGGVYSSLINFLPILFSAAWLPLICMSIRKFLLAPSIRWFALASLFLGLQFLVGEPTTVIQTGLIAGMYALYRGWHTGRERSLGWRGMIRTMLQPVGWVGLISVAAFAVGSAQMLPAIDHAAHSIRARGLDFVLVGTWSMPWVKLLELAYPNVLGYISDDSRLYWGRGLYPRRGLPFLFSLYPGMLITSLAAGACLARVRGTRLVLILAGSAFLLALGIHTPLLRLLYDLGIARSLRYPEKFALSAVFTVTVFGAMALQSLLDGAQRVRTAALVFTAAAGAFAAAMALAAFTPLYTQLYRAAGLSSALNPGVMELSHRAWVAAAARAAMLLVILWAMPRVRRPLWIMLAGVFMVGDLAPVTHQLNPRLPASFFVEPPEIVASLPQNRDEYRIFFEADWYTRGAQAQNYLASGSSLYWVIRAGLYPMTTAQHGFHIVMDIDYDETALLPTRDFVQSLWDVKASGRSDWWRPFMAMSNASFRAVYRDFESEMRRVGGVIGRARPIGFIAARRWPRYYFADQMVPIGDRRDFVEKLSNGSYSERVAFVRERAFTPASGFVHRWDETANTATIDVEAAGRAFLVMSVTPHKYWTITIDGTPVDAVSTNIGYQGVEVPTGRHRVEMRYRNSLVPIGVGISLGTIFLLLAAALRPPKVHAVNPRLV